MPIPNGTRMCRPPLVERSVTTRAPQAVSQAQGTVEIGVDLFAAVALAVEVQGKQGGPPTRRVQVHRGHLGGQRLDVIPPRRHVGLGLRVEGLIRSRPGRE